LVLGLVASISMGAPVALSAVDAPIAAAVLSLFVHDAAADITNTQTAHCDTTDDITNSCNNASSITDNSVDNRVDNRVDNSVDNSETHRKSTGGTGYGHGGDADAGDGVNGGQAILHDLVTAPATSVTPLSLGEFSTGDIENDPTIIIEDTDETVVINMAGNPGSSGVQVMNVGAPAQAINTGGNNNTGDASGGSGGDATGGHGTGVGGNG